MAGGVDRGTTPRRGGTEEWIAFDLEARLRTRLDDPTLTVRGLEPYGAGHSGQTYRVTIAGRDGRRSCVLRLSPAGVRLAGPADIGRQGAIMAALREFAVPVPAVVDFDSGPAVAERSFALTEYVAGKSSLEAAEAFSDMGVAEGAVRALRVLQRVPPARVLADEAPVSPAGELRRWRSLLERAGESPDADAEPLLRRLEATTPRASPPVLVHGDYHYGNLLFARGEVVAIVDWEIAGVGEPLVDLASLYVASMRSLYAPDPNPTADFTLALDALLGFYGERPETIRWFVAAGCLKYAAILVYNRSLHRRGRRHDPYYDRLETTIQRLLYDGLRCLEDGEAL